MTVQELIEELSHMPQGAKVHFAYGYGDHWRTTVAPRVSRVGTGLVQHSDYHQMDRLVEFDYEDETDSDAREVVILE